MFFAGGTPLKWGIFVLESTCGLTPARRRDRLSGMNQGPTRVDRHRTHLAVAKRRIREACNDAVTTAELIDGLRAPLNDALGLSGLLLSATDPDTTALGTATVVEHLPEDIAMPWMQNEFLEDDFNKFTQLHETGTATTLHRATQERPQLSPRYRELHRPYGLGPELRATFSRGKACWGVANLVREAGERDFDDESIAWLERLAPMVATGIQRTTAFAMRPDVETDVPGVVMLGPDDSVVSMTAAAGRALADMWLCPFGEDDTFRLPGEAYMVATLARARAEGGSASLPAVTRLHGRSGRWLTLRGDCMLTADGELSGIVLIIGPSQPAEMLPLVAASYGLTGREREVLDELTTGRTSGEVATRLFISEHTVRDHVKSILSKTGTSSRGELMSLIFQRGVNPTAASR